ncbi:MAG: class I SAM-dependent methyltransferase [Bacteroidota bacterium]
MKNRHWFAMMGHTKIVAIIGIITAGLLLILMPQMKWVAGATLGIVLIHVAVLLVLWLSVAVVLPAKLTDRIKGFFYKTRNNEKFDAGWSVGWLNGFWVIAVAFLALAVHVYLSFPGLQLLAFFLFLLSINFFIGNLVVRSPKNTRYLTLPYVTFLKDGTTHVLDAGCGAGRTTIALSKIYPGKITAFDLFDADYIDGGGNTLLEKNLKREGIIDRVEIVQGDITDTKYPDGTFDAVISTYLIDHLGDQKLNALREIRRILKPGGRMLMIVLTPTLSSFAILSVLSLMLAAGQQWKKHFIKAELKLIDEGEVNGGTFFLIEK